MQVNGFKIKKKEKELCIIKMEINMMGFGQMIKSLVLEFIYFLIMICIQEVGEMINEMVMVYF